MIVVARGCCFAAAQASSILDLGYFSSQPRDYYARRAVCCELVTKLLGHLAVLEPVVNFRPGEVDNRL
jgi:hypothetical protein